MNSDNLQYLDAYSGLLSVYLQDCLADQFYGYFASVFEHAVQISTKQFEQELSHSKEQKDGEQKTSVNPDQNSRKFNNFVYTHFLNLLQQLKRNEYQLAEQEKFINTLLQQFPFLIQLTANLLRYIMFTLTKHTRPTTSASDFEAFLTSGAAAKKLIVDSLQSAAKSFDGNPTVLDIRASFDFQRERKLMAYSYIKTAIQQAIRWILPFRDLIMWSIPTLQNQPILQQLPTVMPPASIPMRQPPPMPQRQEQFQRPINRQDTMNRQDQLQHLRMHQDDDQEENYRRHSNESRRYSNESTMSQIPFRRPSHSDDRNPQFDRNQQDRNQQNFGRKPSISSQQHNFTKPLMPIQLPQNDVVVNVERLLKEQREHDAKIKADNEKLFQQQIELQKDQARQIEKQNEQVKQALEKQQLEFRKQQQLLEYQRTKFEEERRREHEANQKSERMKQKWQQELDQRREEQSKERNREEQSKERNREDRTKERSREEQGKERNREEINRQNQFKNQVMGQDSREQDKETRDEHRYSQHEEERNQQNGLHQNGNEAEEPHQNEHEEEQGEHQQNEEQQESAPIIEQMFTEQIEEYTEDKENGEQNKKEQNDSDDDFYTKLKFPYANQSRKSSESSVEDDVDSVAHRDQDLFSGFPTSDTPPPLAGIEIV